MIVYAPDTQYTLLLHWTEYEIVTIVMKCIELDEGNHNTFLYAKFIFREQVFVHN